MAEYPNGYYQNQVAALDSICRVGLEHRPLTVEPIPIERYADLIEGPARLTGQEPSFILNGDGFEVE